jgi:hypothetical protein
MPLQDAMYQMKSDGSKTGVSSFSFGFISCVQRLMLDFLCGKFSFKVLYCPFERYFSIFTLWICQVRRYIFSGRKTYLSRTTANLLERSFARQSRLNCYFGFVAGERGNLSIPYSAG